jgi:class 3 adenylate cyclase
MPTKLIDAPYGGGEGGDLFGDGVDVAARLEQLLSASRIKCSESRATASLEPQRLDLGLTSNRLRTQHALGYLVPTRTDYRSVDEA